MTRHGISKATMLAGLPAPVAVLRADPADRSRKFREDVPGCWNPSAGGTVVTVAFGVNRKGTVVDDGLRSIPREVSGTTSFTAARRAILVCGQTGFDLPRNRYDAWRETEMTFDQRVEGEQ
ncbi:MULTISPECIES: hypothetical protein [unclassified Roseovarius]|uniref:hypothetical protein n=1 Tax=unclassified Roseovarius TaxID=2614913 RepID=UPI00273FFC49|nr:hypothetical protein [Roseovarius sp. MMSF_3350]